MLFLEKYGIKKFNQKWLASFDLGLSMLVGMASAVLVNLLYKG